MKNDWCKCAGKINPKFTENYYAYKDRDHCVLISTMRKIWVIRFIPTNTAGASPLLLRFFSLTPPIARWSWHGDCFTPKWSLRLLGIVSCHESYPCSISNLWSGAAGKKLSIYEIYDFILWLCKFQGTQYFKRSEPRVNATHYAGLTKIASDASFDRHAADGRALQSYRAPSVSPSQTWESTTESTIRTRWCLNHPFEKYLSKWEESSLIFELNI